MTAGLIVLAFLAGVLVGLSVRVGRSEVDREVLDAIKKRSEKQ